MVYHFGFTQHAVARFVERVAPRMGLDEAQSWLEIHARKATPLPFRTMRGQRQWFLPGPAERDAVLVTKDDPGGVLAVVTVGWFEHEPEVMPEEAHLPLPPLQPAWTRPAWLPPMPAELAAPPGSFLVGLGAEGQTLDLDAMSYDDLAGWLSYLRSCFKAYNQRSVTPPAHLVAVKGKIKAAALAALGALTKANEEAKRAAAAGLSPPRPRYTHAELVHALGEVLRERLGEAESQAIFDEAKRRVVPQEVAK